jgi:hypothetical protein
MAAGGLEVLEAGVVYVYGPHYTPSSDNLSTFGNLQWEQILQILPNDPTDFMHFGM